MLSLVYNKPYSLSNFFYTEMAKQMEAPAREIFFLYPRFIMMILNHLLPDLLALPEIIQVSTIDRRVYSDCLHHNIRRPTNERPQPTALFGYIIDPAYVAPPNNGWLNIAGEVNEQDAPAEREAIINDVLIPLENPQPQDCAPVDPDVAAIVVQNVLQLSTVQPDDPIDDWLAEIDNYIGGDQGEGPSTAGDTNGRGSLNC